MKDTGERVSGGHRVLELRCRCGNVFKRQARRLKKKYNPCRSCLKRSVSPLKFWPSYRLKEIIRNEGYTDKGTEYYHELQTAKEIVWEREDRKRDEMLEFRSCNCIEN